MWRSSEEVAQKGMTFSGLLFLGKSKKGDISPLLDRCRKPPLMSGAGSRKPPRNNLSSFRQKSFHRIDILVIDFEFFNAKPANFFPLE
jgi:hypothetical protein